jgi:hypothetical protein
MVCSPELTSSEQLSPVIRALRHTTDEVQFGRVIAAICQDPAVAAAFAAGVLRRAKGGNVAARRRSRKLPDTIRCVEEQRLEARVSRRGLKQRARDAGRVDLDFAGSGGWKMVVELKLGAGFGDKQLERYGEEGPVAAVVRNRVHVPVLRDHPGWLGAAIWRELLPDLEDLPVEPRWRPEWLQLLRVMDIDGDFATAAPDGLPEVVEARKRLETAAPAVLDGFRADLTRVYGPTAEAAVRRLRHTKPYGKRGPWAGFGLATPGEGAWVFFEIRNLWSPAPRLRLWHWHWADWRSRKAARAAYPRLRSNDGFRQLPDGAVFELPLPELANARGDVIAHVLKKRLAELVDADLFDVDVRHEAKHYT